ncbi:quinone oxidoreductase [Holosporaceae bacterium 'Namur']|nr:quinone oxidoreductase [Holosporaceae bacterium 'Namur']
MGKFVYFDQVGTPEVLKIGEREEGEPLDNEVLLKHTAIGVNFIDVQTRRGSYNSTDPICGIEACGVIKKLGKKVEGFEIGQRVAYATVKSGAYSEFRCIDSKYLVAVPDHISDETIAASLVKGLTAHYLIRRVFLVREGVAVLIHSAAGGVGQILSAWCRHLGALVIGSVGSEEKKQIALKSCHYVVNHKTADWEKEVVKFTKNIGVNAVYDAIGKDTFYKSLDCLMTGGIMVYYGHASGLVEPLDLELLKKKSLFLTCPTLFDYKANKMELILSAEEVFEMITSKVLNINIAAKFPLSQAAEAHKLLESGASSGSIILIP